jgi:hypothetical protein
MRRKTLRKMRPVRGAHSFVYDPAYRCRDQRRGGEWAAAKMHRMLSDKLYDGHGNHQAICVRGPSTDHQLQNRPAAEQANDRCSREACLEEVNCIRLTMDLREHITNYSQHKPRSKLSICFLMPHCSSCAGARLHWAQHSRWYPTREPRCKSALYSGLARAQHRSTPRMHAGDYSLSRWQSTSRSFGRPASDWPDSADVGRTRKQSRVQQLSSTTMTHFCCSVEIRVARPQGEGPGCRGPDRQHKDCACV